MTRDNHRHILIHFSILHTSKPAGPLSPIPLIIILTPSSHLLRRIPLPYVPSILMLYRIALPASLSSSFHLSIPSYDRSINPLAQLLPQTASCYKVLIYHFIPHSNLSYWSQTSHSKSSHLPSNVSLPCNTLGDTHYYSVMHFIFAKSLPSFSSLHSSKPLQPFTIIRLCFHLSIRTDPKRNV